MSVAADLDARQESGARARVVSRVRFEARAPGLRVLPLALASETVDGSDTVRAATLERVTVDGIAARYVADRNQLLIFLAEPVAVGKSLEVKTTWVGDLFNRPSGDNYWRIGNGPWYPKPAGSGTAEAASFRLSLEVKKPFVPFAPGRTLGRTATEEANRVVTELKGPMSDAFLAAGKYATATLTLGDFRLGITTFGTRLEGEREHVGQVVVSARTCLADLLAEPYPFSDLHLLEVNQWGWGQAPPGMIFITKEAFLSKARLKAMPTHRDFARAMVANVDARLVHELAHGWFPHVAKINENEEGWLSESFAEYVAAVCVSLLPSRPSEREAAWRTQQLLWREFAEPLRSDPAASVFLASHLEDPAAADFSARQALLYGKGPLVLHALRRELGRQAGNEPDGDRLFFGWLRRYLQERRFEIARTRDAVAILETMTGKPWRPWFEKYVLGGEMPPLD